jgi:beta-fructofuranosidase
MMNDTKIEQDFAAQRQLLVSDGQRPVYHFLPPANWINDPHGLIRWNGLYHLFYQYNPNGPFHSTIHWGHAISEDFVQWRDLPIALAPDPDGCDPDGCWTGCAVDDDGLPTIYYSAASPQTIAAAISYDKLLTWQKLPENPLLDGPPPELRPLSGGNFRDPFIWKTDEGWEMLIVTKIEGQGGQVLLYFSPDLRNWEYRGIFLAGNSRQTDPFWQGTMWECPNWLDFGDRQTLLVSIQSTPEDHLYTVYFTGRREANIFMPEYNQMLVHGNSFYAPQVMPITKKSFLMIGWLHEERSYQACQESGWSGSLSLPMTLDLREDGALAINPLSDLQTLRGELRHINSLQLLDETESKVFGISGKALEIQATFEFHGDSEFGLKVFCSPDDEEQTRIVYKREFGQILVERQQSSLDQRADVNPATIPVHLASGNPVQMRVFIDHSIIEIFLNDTLCLACRVYPTRADSDGVRFFSRRGLVEVTDINIWKMDAIWPTQRKINDTIGSEGV